MTGFAGGFNRLKMAILVTGLTGDISMDIVKLEPGIYIVLKEQVISCPTGGGMTFLTFRAELRCVRILMTCITPGLISFQ